MTLEALRHLSPADLRHLRDLISTGRLGPPFSGAALSSALPSGNREAVAEALGRLSSEGLNPAHMALLLEVIAEERSQAAAAGDIVELVWTGPEAGGVANRDTAVVVRELFAGARESVLVAGYAVYQGREVFKSLAERMEAVPDLKVKMFLDVHRSHGDSSPDSEVVARFAATFKQREWPGQRRMPEVYYDPRSLATDSPKRASLHAKCVVVDRAVAFVSSANFTEAAQERNIEVGALVKSASFATSLAEHFEKLVEGAQLLRVPGY